MVSTVDVGGITIAYQRAGDGEPLFFLHGYVGDSNTWRPQIDALCDDFAVVAWDAPGFGGSDDPPDNFLLADYADCAAGFVDALGFNRVHVVGLSFGGILALEVYRRHPEHSKSLLLVSAYAGWPGSLPAEQTERRLQQALRLADLAPDRLVAELLPTMFASSPPAEAVVAFREAMLGTHSAGFRATARASAERDLTDVLAMIDVPTLLVYGDADVRAPLDVAHDLRSRIRDSKLVVIPGAGHVLNVEAPERFNDEVRRFLTSVG